MISPLEAITLTMTSHKEVTFIIDFSTEKKSMILIFDFPYINFLIINLFMNKNKNLLIFFLQKQ